MTDEAEKKIVYPKDPKTGWAASNKDGLPLLMLVTKSPGTRKWLPRLWMWFGEKILKNQPSGMWFPVYLYGQDYTHDAEAHYLFRVFEDETEALNSKGAVPAFSSKHFRNLEAADTIIGGIACLDFTWYVNLSDEHRKQVDSLADSIDLLQDYYHSVNTKRDEKNTTPGPA